MIGDELIQQVKKNRYLESLDNVLYCDRWYNSPKAAFAYHNELSGFVSDLRQRSLVDPEVLALLAKGEELPETASDIEKGALRFLKEKVHQAQQIPADLAQEVEKMNAIGQQAWEQAYEANDLTDYLPVMAQQFELRRKIAAAIDPTQHPYQVLVNLFDPEFSLEEIDSFFDQVKSLIIELLKDFSPLTDSDRDQILKAPASKAQMQAAGQHVLALLQFSQDNSTLYESRHPVCACVGPRDSRPSTNYQELLRSIGALMHEAGHGMYNYNSSEEVVAAGLWGGLEGATHESQSIFYEKMVGTSFEFWQAFYPTLQKLVPHYQDILLTEFYQAYTAINITPLRLSADELTYLLHIIIRYELEKGYYEGEYQIHELPTAWDQKYQEYLGVTPQDLRQGILQDVHWGSGHIGYFQGYALGGAYAAQFKQKLLKDLPTAFEELAQGNIGSINQWLAQQVHRHGQVYSSRQLLQKATGEDFNGQYYIDYLRQKYQKTNGVFYP